MAKILLVDDNEGFRTALKHLLISGGHEVVAVSDGREALEELQNQTFDLLLSDIIMPGLDGYRLLHEWRQLPRRPRAIMMSGGSVMANPNQYVDVASDLGASRTLRKPFSRKALLRAIEETMTAE